MTDQLTEQEQEVARGRAPQTPFVLIAVVAVCIAAVFAVAVALAWLAGLLG
jgi:hypothetical protein